MIFYGLLTDRSLKSANKKNYIHKSISDDKVLSSAIKKAWCTRNFLDHFKEAIEQ